MLIQECHRAYRDPASGDGSFPRNPSWQPFVYGSFPGASLRSTGVLQLWPINVRNTCKLSHISPLNIRSGRVYWTNILTKMVKTTILVKMILFRTGFFGGWQRAVFQKGGLADVAPEQKPERGYIRMFPRNETGTGVRSPKPPFYEPPFCLPVNVSIRETKTVHFGLSAPKSHNRNRQRFPPEIPQKKGGFGLRHRNSKSQIASDFPSHP